MVKSIIKYRKEGSDEIVTVTVTADTEDEAHSLSLKRIKCLESHYPTSFETRLPDLSGETMYSKCGYYSYQPGRNQKQSAPDSVEKTTITGDWATRRVWVGKIELLPDASWKVCNHSPDGFNWSYGGSGPAQLALAILLEVTHDQSFSIAYYQRFKWVVIANLPKGNFVLPLRTVTEWVNKVRRGEQNESC